MHGVFLAFGCPEDSWFSLLTRRYPSLAVHVLNLVTGRNGKTIKTVRLDGSDSGGALAWLEKQGWLERGLILEQEPQSATLRMVSRSSFLGDAIAATDAVPQFPFTIVGQEVRWLMLEDSPATVRLLGWLEAQDIRVRTVRSGEWHLAHDDLTPRQQRSLDAAIAAGFYDYPRRITLTELADRLGVSKSTLSESLMVIEHKVMAARQARPGATSQPSGFSTNPTFRPGAA